MDISHQIFAPVVQWIECELPELKILVRFQSGAKSWQMTELKIEVRLPARVSETNDGGILGGINMVWLKNIGCFFVLEKHVIRV